MRQIYKTPHDVKLMDEEHIGNFDSSNTKLLSDTASTGNVREIANRFNSGSDNSSPLHVSSTSNINSFYDYEDDGEGSFDNIAPNQLLDDSPLYNSKSSLSSAIPDVPVSRTFDQFGRRISTDENDGRSMKKKPTIPSPTKTNTFYQKTYFDTVSSTKTQISTSPSNELSPRSSSGQIMKRTTSFDNFNAIPQENTTPKRNSQKLPEVKKKDLVVASTHDLGMGNCLGQVDNSFSGALARCLFCGRNAVQGLTSYDKSTDNEKKQIQQKSIAIQVQPTVKSCARQTVINTYNKATQMYAYRHDQSTQV